LKYRVQQYESGEDQFINLNTDHPYTKHHLNHKQIKPHSSLKPK